MSSNWVSNLDISMQNKVLDADSAAQAAGQTPSFGNAYYNPYAGQIKGGDSLQQLQADEFRSSGTNRGSEKSGFSKYLTGALVLAGAIAFGAICYFGGKGSGTTALANSGTSTKYSFKNLLRDLAEKRKETKLAKIEAKKQARIAKEERKAAEAQAKADERARKAEAKERIKTNHKPFETCLFNGVTLNTASDRPLFSTYFKKTGRKLFESTITFA